MKNIFLMLALVATLAGAACQGAPAQEEQSTKATTGQETTTEASKQLAYVCPMACEGSASEAPGKCPVCGMDLVENPDQPAAVDSAAHPAH
jgi:rubrerythrin